MKKWFWLVGLMVVGWSATAQTSQPAKSGCTVYFYRDRMFVGSAIRGVVKDNKETVGIVQNGAYFAYEADRGTHLFSTGARYRTIDCKSGESHYLRLAAVSGLLFARFVLLVEPDDGPAALKMLKETSGSVEPSKKGPTKRAGS